MADRRAQALIEQTEGRKLFEEALREIELGHSTYEAQLSRIKEARKSCGQSGPRCRHWTIAEKMLKKAQAAKVAKPLQKPPVDESEAL